MGVGSDSPVNKTFVYSALSGGVTLVFVPDGAGVSVSCSVSVTDIVKII